MGAMWFGIPLEFWWITGGFATGWAWLQGMRLWDRYHPIKMSWCQGCDQLQPSACFRWTQIGLFRCGNCRENPPLLDTAKEIEATIRARQFTDIRWDKYLDWRCQCGSVARHYEWKTGRRYCDKHMKEVPLMEPVK